MLLERRDRLEKILLTTLRKHPFGWFNAFQSLARNTRFIYIHAYQSYVWNRAVSERLAKFGRKVLVGDLAVRKEQAYLLENIAGQDDHQAAEDSDHE